MHSKQRLVIGEALWGMCAADAMSMPVHWYYNVRDIKRDFGGWITSFDNPREKHPSSILTLSNIAGSGRIGKTSRCKPPVIGNVILHDKLKYWNAPTGNVHYHQGLQAGENTLNTLCAMRVGRMLTSRKFESMTGPSAQALVLSDYVKFMTTPGSHNDTYAESFHRSFFSDWQELPPTLSRDVFAFAEMRYKERMKGQLFDSQLEVIGCLPMAIPFILLSTSDNEDKAVSASVQFVRLTHPHPKLEKYVELYARMLHATLNGSDLRHIAETALKSPVLDAWDDCQSFMQKAARFPKMSEERLRVHQNAVEMLGLACYIKGALSSLFYLAHEFHDDIQGGILANTNCGGENCNRGAALGALLGCQAGHTGKFIPQEWKDCLKNAKEDIAVILQNML